MEQYHSWKCIFFDVVDKLFRLNWIMSLVVMIAVLLLECIFFVFLLIPLVKWTIIISLLIWLFVHPIRRFRMFLWIKCVNILLKSLWFSCLSCTVVLLPLSSFLIFMIQERKWLFWTIQRTLHIIISNHFNRTLHNTN